MKQFVAIWTSVCRQPTTNTYRQSSSVDAPADWLSRPDKAWGYRYWYHQEVPPSIRAIQYIQAAQSKWTVRTGTIPFSHWILQ